MSETLKPCPICGGTPRVDHKGILLSSGKRKYNVECVPGDGHYVVAMGDTLDLAIERWNRRTNP